MLIVVNLLLPALLALAAAFPLGYALRIALFASPAVVRAVPLVALFAIAAVAIYVHAAWLIGFASSYGYDHPDQPIGMYPALARFRHATIALEVAGAILMLALVRQRPRWSALVLVAMPLVYGVLFLWLRGSKPLLPIDLLGFFYLVVGMAVLAIFGAGYVLGREPGRQE